MALETQPTQLVAAPSQEAPAAETEELQSQQSRAGANLEEPTKEVQTCKECKQEYAVEEDDKQVCKHCRNLKLRLWRRLGAWSTFNSLSDTERERFFVKTQGTSCWRTIQSQLVETLTRQRVSETRSETGGSYLPASVLLTQGYTQDVIDACSDTEENPALGGTTYRLKVHSEYCVETEKTVREELLNRVKQVCAGKQVPKEWDVQRPEKPGKNEKPDRTEEKEDKHKAKFRKVALALAKSALPQVSAAWCSLQTAVSGAGLPADLEEAKKGELLGMLRKLGEWKNACEHTLANKENLQDLPVLPFRKDEVKPTCKAAAEQLKDVKLCRAAAAKLKRESKAAEKAKQAAAPAGEPKAKRPRTAAKRGA
ncbi:unnamed protein product [Symbiodinium sp. CCMP2592]|nr:unnamed protein product [Symbiodinium sp. CCMP2592]